MVYGIGIDLVNIDRIKKAVDRWGQKFLSRVFTENELSYCLQKKTPYPSLAVRFAAKEAFIKAIRAGITLSFTDIEVVSKETGEPVLCVSSRIEEFLAANSITRTHLSLSHEHEYGVACVLLEKE